MDREGCMYNVYVCMNKLNKIRKLEMEEKVKIMLGIKKKAQIRKTARIGWGQEAEAEACRSLTSSRPVCFT